MPECTGQHPLDLPPQKRKRRSCSLKTRKRHEKDVCGGSLRKPKGKLGLIISGILYILKAESA